MRPWQGSSPADCAQNSGQLPDVIADIYTTRLTRRPGTTITFFGVAPARNADTFSSASAAASSVSALASAGTEIRPRTLPFTCTGYSTLPSTRYRGSAFG